MHEIVNKTNMKNLTIYMNINKEIDELTYVKPEMVRQKREWILLSQLQKMIIMQQKKFKFHVFSVC